MTASLPPYDKSWTRRFPDFDLIGQSRLWDDATREVVLGRLAEQSPLRFFSALEARTAAALFDQLLDQHAEPRIPVLQFIDDRLARDETDGWRYETMPKDPDAWRRSLAALDADAVQKHKRTFGELRLDEQAAIIQSVQDLGDEKWHAMPAAQIWSLWTRYACTAFYAHPDAWREMGFGGPAYPRGYKNIGVDRLEGFEVRDVEPNYDPSAAS